MRVGDIDYAAAHDANVTQTFNYSRSVQLPYSYRVIHAHDFIPHIPFKLEDPPFFHHRYEVWYVNDHELTPSVIISLSSVNVQVQQQHACRDALQVLQSTRRRFLFQPGLGPLEQRPQCLLHVQYVRWCMLFHWLPATLNYSHIKGRINFCAKLSIHFSKQILWHRMETHLPGFDSISERSHHARLFEEKSA